MIEIFVIIGIAVLIASVYTLVDRIYVKIKLKQHQKEWDCKLRELIKNGASQEIIDENYCCYVNFLIINGHPFFGACIPAKWSGSVKKESENNNAEKN